MTPSSKPLLKELVIKPVLEKKVKEAINKLVKKIWPRHWRFMPVQTGLGKSGVPDHIFCVPVVITQEMVGKTYGMFIGEEAKRFGKRPTPSQYDNLAEICGAGGFGHFTAGLEEVPALEAKLRKRFCMEE